MLAVAPSLTPQVAPARRGSASVLLAALLLAGLAPAARAQVQIEVNRPRSAFECDLPKAQEWYGSTERCLTELCAGENVTNRYVIDRRGDLRKNPCYGRTPSELDHER